MFGADLQAWILIDTGDWLGGVAQLESDKEYSTHCSSVARINVNLQGSGSDTTPNLPYPSLAWPVLIRSSQTVDYARSRSLVLEIICSPAPYPLSHI